jgi:hypothetical protein
MKVFTILENGIPTDGINTVEEGSLLRIYFDYAVYDMAQTDESGNETKVENSYSCENVDIDGKRDYSSIVAAIVSSKYSNDDVTAIIANKALADDSTSDITDAKRTEYQTEYTNFQTWRSHAKDVADKVISKLES